MARQSRGGTPATVRLDQLGIPYRLIAVADVPYGSPEYGTRIAAALGVPHDVVFKSLIAVITEKPVLAVIPVSERLDLKRLGKAHGDKHVRMADTTEAERWSGSVPGGICALAVRREMPVYADESLVRANPIYLSAGKRGLELELDPADFVTACSVTLASLTAVRP